MDETLEIRRAKATALDAWPVVSSTLFDVATSDDIASIVGRAGLEVDWALTPKESFSHSTRKRAYRPRVHTAYLRLGAEDRGITLSLVAAELARRYPGQSQEIKAALVRVGWTLKTTRDLQPEQGNTMKRDIALQKLLLLQVRDGKEPPELAHYSESQQVHNSALLINDGYVRGEAIAGGDGAYTSTVMIELTSKGHDFLDKTERVNQEPDRMRKEADPNPASARDAVHAEPRSSKLIFVSHSTTDRDLADAIVDLLCTALHLRVSDFVCTSVDGARLRGGDLTDDALRREIRQVPAFLSLLTPNAIASTYVLFELGARWGIEKHHIPLLGKGAGNAVLKDPLKATNALHLNSEAEVFQLVEDLARALEKQAEPTASYYRKALKVVEISRYGEAVAKAEHRAKDQLMQCVGILRGGLTTQAAVDQIRIMQNSWRPDLEQVTIVFGDTILLHAKQNLEGKNAEECWIQEDSDGTSLFIAMLEQGSGARNIRIKGYPNRLTVIAFQRLEKLNCLVVAEAHELAKAGG